MKKYIVLILLPAASFAAIGPEFKPDEILIQYKSGVSSRDRALGDAGAIALREVTGKKGLVHAKLVLGQSVSEALTRLESDPDVEYAQPNFIYRISAIPNDPNFQYLWGLHNTAQTVPTLSAADSADPTNNPPTGGGGGDMDMPAAWDFITDCGSVTVAIVDTGIKYDHEDLAANMWDQAHAIAPHFGHNSVTGAPNASDPMDDHGHGTHVSGTIGAVGNNGVGSTGVCWKASLMAVKVLASDGSGTTADIADGVNWAVSHGAKVINMSLGGSSADPVFLSALQNAQSQGVVVVVAAGNDGANNDVVATYPCNYHLSNMICVAALDQSFSLASFSNYGASTVDVGAPGVNIVSAWPYHVTAVSDDFSSGWTNNGGWGMHANLNVGAGAHNTFSVPANWDGTVQYPANDDARVYKTFDLSGGYHNVQASYWAYWDTESGHDFVNVYSKSSGGDPTGGNLIAQYTGSSNGYLFSESSDVGACLTSSCSIGFQFTSDAANQATGSLIFGFELKKNTYATNQYNVIEGTSMATPHVAGLAAMVFAYNPNATAADVVSAVKNGGAGNSALSGKTTMGKAVNALGSLAYINAPSGVTASKAQ